MTMGGGMVGVAWGKKLVKQIMWGEKLHRQNCIVRLIAGFVP